MATKEVVTQSRLPSQQSSTSPLAIGSQSFHLGSLQSDGLGYQSSPLCGSSGFVESGAGFNSVHTPMSGNRPSHHERRMRKKQSLAAWKSDEELACRLEAIAPILQDQLLGRNSSGSSKAMRNIASHNFEISFKDMNNGQAKSIQHGW